ncbi:MAG: DUF3108 domain-containing protein [Lewinellaceae bacterium]|nr:DUF3108 domain-containing protein [Saprospiraceae bacterium]MCB9340320.1 DUF3108 domain-containing protein [Lewinellaceae bacterium]
MATTPKSFFFSTLLLLFPFVHLPEPSETNPTNPGLGKLTANPCNTSNFAFQAGEELTYKVYYNWNFVWLSAAEITFRVIDDDDQYHYQVVGETYHTYDWFFKVRDYYDTWVQKDNLLPIMSIRNIEEGKYRLYDYLNFDQSRKTCYNERGKAKNDIRERKSYTLDGCMHDMLSILYFARNIRYDDYQPGDSFPIKIFADKETWPLEVTYRGKESGKKIKGLGKFDTMRFSPQVIEGEIFPKDTDMNVWVTDDSNRLPLIIESPLSVGSVKAVLKSYKGLRYSLNSFVND